MKSKIIVVFCHSRAKLLDKCLKSLKDVSGLESWKLIVIHQNGNKDVDEVLNKYKGIIYALVNVNPNFNFALGNINFNRILGTKIAFETFNAECMLGIEEDNVVSNDCLIFIDYILNQYSKKKAFRGINLGSMEYGNEISGGSYSLLRYGLHGSAGLLTDKSWRYIKRKKLFDFDLNNPNTAWDSQIEFYLKSGFMVTPNLSKNLDLGNGGTFAPISKSDNYFVKIKKSWIQNSNYTRFGYHRKQINHGWRNDAIGYKKIHSFFYFFRKYGVFVYFSRLVGLNKVILRGIGHKF